MPKHNRGFCVGLDSRKQATATAPPLKDIIYLPVANLRLTLFSGSTFLALHYCYKWKVQGVGFVLGLFCVAVFFFGFGGFLKVFFLVFFFYLLLHERRRYFKGWKYQG